MGKPTLVLLCGLPRSGKSTKARHTTFPIVCPDDIRLALHGQPYATQAEGFVWSIAKVMVRSLFLSGHPIVILDACNNTRKRRDEWRREDWRTALWYMPAGAEVCRSRACADNRVDLVLVIERMAEQHEPPQEDEILWS